LADHFLQLFDVATDEMINGCTPITKLTGVKGAGSTATETLCIRVQRQVEQWIEDDLSGRINP
jgi:hypothetical protein